MSAHAFGCLDDLPPLDEPPRKMLAPITAWRIIITHSAASSLPGVSRERVFAASTCSKCGEWLFPSSWHTCKRKSAFMRTRSSTASMGLAMTPLAPALAARRRSGLAERARTTAMGRAAYAATLGPEGLEQSHRRVVVEELVINDENFIRVCGAAPALPPIGQSHHEAKTLVRAAPLVTRQTGTPRRHRSRNQGSAPRQGVPAAAPALWSSAFPARGTRHERSTAAGKTAGRTGQRAADRG